MAATDTPAGLDQAAREAARPSNGTIPDDCAPCAGAKAKRKAPAAPPAPAADAPGMGRGERLAGITAVLIGAVIVIMGVDVATGFAISRGLGILPSEEHNGNRGA